jgi:hypothetical protein
MKKKRSTARVMLLVNWYIQYLLFVCVCVCASDEKKEEIENVAH